MRVTLIRATGSRLLAQCIKNVHAGVDAGSNRVVAPPTETPRASRTPSLRAGAWAAGPARINEPPRASSIRLVALPAGCPYTRRVSTIERSYRYIVRTPGVRGGHARIEGTRVGVHDVIGLLQTGETVDSLIARCLPDLTGAQVYECLAYYEDHRGEIDVLVARQMSADS